VVITEAELVRDILSNKFGHFEKFTNKSLGKMIALGVASYDGEKWAKHRRILNPAFHLEKLKVGWFRCPTSFSSRRIEMCACLLLEWVFAAHAAGVLDVLHRAH
jgi:hypothetical protein